MITRQRAITQQFSQQKSTRSTALKGKVQVTDVTVVSPSPAAVALVETSTRSTTRLRSASRKGATAKSSPSVVKAAPAKTIEECFKEVLIKTASPATPAQTQVTKVAGRPTPLQDKGNTPLRREIENGPAVVQSPVSVAHKTEVFNDSLKLPVTYETLLSQFVATDRCIAMMGNRNETVTFAKLKTSVETATKRFVSSIDHSPNFFKALFYSTFTENSLGQMLHVFPGCYKLNYSQTHYTSSTTELTIRADCMAGVDKEDLQLSPKSHLTVTLMTMREKVFRQALLKLVVESHTNYLKSLSPGLSVQVDASKLRRWHPNFPLETAVPVINVAQLPARSVAANSRRMTAKEMLEHYAQKTPHLAKFLESGTTAAADPVKVPSVAAPSNPHAFKIIKSGPFAGLREDLVAKVRDRERRDKDLAASTDPVADLNRIRRGRLPQLIRIVRGLFFRGTKSVSLKDLHATVRYSWPSPISEDEVQATFDLLVATCPQWIRVLKVSISPDPLVQIEVGTDTNELIASLSSAAC